MPVVTDPRLTPPDSVPVAYQVTAGVAAVRETPASDGRLATVALHGEVLDVFGQAGDFVHVQCRRDRYVGWVDMAALSAPVLPPTHKISALRTYCYAEANLKSAPRFLLSLGAHVVAEEIRGDWVGCARAGWVHARHLSAVDTVVADPVAVAELFVNTPYLWGGRESLGLDCTGLTQQAFEAAGVILPRDSDMQAAWAGREIGDWQTPGSRAVAARPASSVPSAPPHTPARCPGSPRARRGRRMPLRPRPEPRRGRPRRPRSFAYRCANVCSSSCLR